MATDLEEKIKAYQNGLIDQEQTRNNSMNSLAPRLPIAILFLKEDLKFDNELVKEWFRGSASIAFSTSDTSKSGYGFIDAIAYVASSTRSEVDDVIVINCAVDKDDGFLMAKTTGQFADYFYITDVSQIDLLARLASLFEEYESSNIFAAQLEDKLWECYDFAREELSTHGLTPDRMHTLTAPITNFRARDNDMIRTATMLVDQVRV